ncbi:MAG TPA: transposase [Thiotrichaceae bacterium]|nr:transposase [Thiotrichaceae bacterium]
MKKKRRTPKEHDNSYKQLFSHPRMVKDLLQGFIPQKWVTQLDFRTLSKVSGHYVSEDLRDREDDIVWKVRRYSQKDEWLYIYLLIEFQSSVDPFMAVRLMVYIGLLYQDLIKTEEISSSQLLPPVLPLVLYNGEDRWYADREISELIAPFPAELEKHCPHLEYLVMDERHDYSDEQLGSQLNNLAANLFQLEKSRTKSETQQALSLLIKWLKQAPPSLRVAFKTWLKRVKLPRHLPGVVLPEFINLQEIETMLATSTDNWLEESKKEGRKEGRKEGKAQFLMSLLEDKFGPLNHEIKATILRLTEAGLLECAKRLWTAQTLQDVIKPEKLTKKKGFTR